MKHLIQIVPNLPPNINGVGDYALQLARGLRERHEIETRFLVANLNWSGPQEVEGFQVVRLNRRCCEVDTSAVLLHYVGYGYSKRGAPLWLVRWMSGLPQSVAKPRVLTFFHELYASGPPWRSSFWLSPLQRWVCRRVARLSQARLTNQADSAAVLRQMTGGEAKVMPVFSNFGEPEAMSEPSQRKPQLVVYGGVNRLPEDRDLAAAKLSELCTILNIKQIVSFGKTPCASFSPDVPVENRGVLTTEEVSSLLQESCAGYIDYPMWCLAKSSIFAAYCAHGLLPVTLRSTCENNDGLRVGYNMLTATDTVPTDRIQFIASAARVWYEEHDLTALAQCVAHEIKPST